MYGELEGDNEPEINRVYSLIGIDGNAYAVMAYVTEAMRAEGKSNAEIDKYLIDAKSGDYSKLISVSVDMIDELNKQILIKG